ncbi:MAG: hypothetical protein ACFFB2_20660 [Promethearchaeota archaeon]
MKFLDTSFLIDLIRKNTSLKELLNEIDKDRAHVTNTIVAHEFLIDGCDPELAESIINFVQDTRY